MKAHPTSTHTGITTPMDGTCTKATGPTKTMTITTGTIAGETITTTTTMTITTVTRT